MSAKVSRAPVSIPGSQRPNVPVTKSTLTIGGFVESNGMVVYLYGWDGHTATVSGCTPKATLKIPEADIYAKFKHRYDINKFPGSPDNRLPYSFDLLYDIKWESQLPQALHHSSEAKGIRKLMKDCGIGLREAKGTEAALKIWLRAETTRELTTEETQYWAVNNKVEEEV